MRRIILALTLLATLAPTFAVKAHAYESWSADSAFAMRHSTHIR